MKGRRVELEVLYNNQNITTEIQDFIDSLTFTDNLSGQADDISISLGDRERRWSNKWRPYKGASLQVSLKISEHWWDVGKVNRKLGYFEIDDLSMNGPPTKVSIKGTSIPESTSLKGEKKSKAWEKTNLKKIAEEIAKKNKLTLHFSVKENPAYDRTDQDSQTDISFLQKLCMDAGLSLKIVNKSIVILDETQLEAGEAVTTIFRTDDRIKDYSLRDTLGNMYKSCKVTYTDPKTKKTLSYTFTPKNPPPTSRILTVNEQVKSKKEAIELAKNSLRNANKEAVTGSIRLAGFLPVYSGQCINLKDFGAFDGKYLSTSIGGSLGSGSETSLELRKCLEDY
ncbi:hypothetical protein K7T73_12915 [Bacillus badius]|uniref:phage late control D family protein n=1 Tax=Bacillus badius TaxID=1455 RepID=UPI001CBCE1F6|nr:contractile injection system protein, VgrG/Pvc8 family [Bacillus badius]UAT29501.1 hypothetical protein K7T73_12915 [Bacillus badius]